MKNLLKDEGFWIYIGIFTLFFMAIVGMKSKKECNYKMLPNDEELKQIEYGDSIFNNEKR